MRLKEKERKTGKKKEKESPKKNASILILGLTMLISPQNKVSL